MRFSCLLIFEMRMKPFAEKCSWRNHLPCWLTLWRVQGVVREGERRVHALSFRGSSTLSRSDPSRSFGRKITSRDRFPTWSKPSHLRRPSGLSRRSQEPRSPHRCSQPHRAQTWTGRCCSSGRWPPCRNLVWWHSSETLLSTTHFLFLHLWGVWRESKAPFCRVAAVIDLGFCSNIKKDMIKTLFEAVGAGVVGVGFGVGFGVGIPDICYRRHGRRPCKFFLPGVKFSRLNAKNLPFYTMAYCL